MFPQIGLSHESVFNVAQNESRQTLKAAKTESNWWKMNQYDIVCTLNEPRVQITQAV